MNDIASIPNLPTTIPDIELRPLTSRDAAEYYDLVQRNISFLTQYGDYEDLIRSTLADIKASFSSPPGDALRMGIWRGEALMGRVDLNPVAPGVYVLGYWLGEEFTGHGYMTAACRALIDYARSTWTVSAFWAGVRHANQESAAVVERLGFSVYEELPDRKRYRLLCP